MTFGTLESKKLHGTKRVTVRVEHHLDTDSDGDYYGAFCNFKQPGADQWLYHRDTATVLDSSGIWRNAKGHIAKEPEENRYSGEFEYIFCDNGQENIKQVLQDARRLEDLNNQLWSYIGIVAIVEYAGAEIGRASCWGFESDSGENFLREEERNIAHEAMSEAREWLKANVYCK